MIPTAALSGARHKQLEQEECLCLKQAQIFMHFHGLLKKRSCNKRTGFLQGKWTLYTVDAAYVSRCVEIQKRHLAPQGSSSKLNGTYIRFIIGDNSITRSVQRVESSEYTVPHLPAIRINFSLFSYITINMNLKNFK